MLLARKIGFTNSSLDLKGVEHVWLWWEIWQEPEWDKVDEEIWSRRSLINTFKYEIFTPKSIKVAFKQWGK